MQNFWKNTFTRVLVTQWLMQSDELYLVLSQMVHPMVSTPVRLLRGIFKQRPSLPHYTVTYDVVKVLQYISNSYSKTYLECLTKKLETLIPILSGQRSQPMSLLNTNYMHIDETYCIFYIASLLKTTRPRFHQCPLEFSAITCIKRHLLKTK